VPPGNVTISALNQESQQIGKKSNGAPRNRVSKRLHSASAIPETLGAKIMKKQR